MCACVGLHRSRAERTVEAVGFSPLHLFHLFDLFRWSSPASLRIQPRVYPRRGTLVARSSILLWCASSRMFASVRRVLAFWGKGSMSLTRRQRHPWSALAGWSLLAPSCTSA